MAAEATEKIINFTVQRFDDPELETPEPTLHKIALPLQADYPQIKQIMFSFLNIDIDTEDKVVKVKCPMRRFIPYTMLLHDFETDKPFIIEVAKTKAPIFLLDEINDEIKAKDPLAELDVEMMNIDKKIMHFENAMPSLFLNSMSNTESSVDDLLNRLEYLKRRLGMKVNDLPCDYP